MNRRRRDNPPSRHRLLLVSGLLVCLATLLAGCATDDGLPPGGAAAQTPDAAGLTGEWTGTGAWPVEWSFRPDGTFTKRDLIAPCPDDVNCIWSGIVTNTGTWELDPVRVKLTYDAADNLEGATTPDELSMSIIGGNIAGLLETNGDALLLEYRRTG